MRNKLATAFALILCLIAAAALAGIPEKVTINAAAKKQPPVTFTHANHATTLAKTCETCHHTQKGMKKDDPKLVVQKCSACHLDPKDKAPSMREVNLQKNPFHVRCISCHKEQKKGPVACTGCHVKKA